MPGRLQPSKRENSPTTTSIKQSSVVAEVVIRSDFEVEACNEVADALFKGLVRVGKSFPETLVGLEKSGILLNSASGGIADALTLGREHGFDMRDGRTFLMTGSTDGSGRVTARSGTEQRWYNSSAWSGSYKGARCGSAKLCADSEEVHRR